MQRGRKESRAIRSRAGCARIEEKLEICGLLTGSRGFPEGASGYPILLLLHSFAPSFFFSLSLSLYLSLPFSKKDSLTSSDNLASYGSPRSGHTQTALFSIDAKDTFLLFYFLFTISQKYLEKCTFTISIISSFLSLF